MTTVADVARWLDDFAPRHLAESWDNVGLLWGDPGAQVTRVMTCLTVTPRIAREAIEEGAELIVSHHPVLFRAVQRVVADHPETGMLWDLARAGVAIPSPHTAFDNTVGGINDGLARRLGPGRRGAAPRPSPPRASFKVVVFTPEADHEPCSRPRSPRGRGGSGPTTSARSRSRGRGPSSAWKGRTPRSARPAGARP